MIYGNFEIFREFNLYKTPIVSHNLWVTRGFEGDKTLNQEAGANVEVFGDYWDMADKEARSRITDDSGKNDRKAFTARIEKINRNFCEVQ